MKKFLILIIAVPFLAASCNGDLFSFGGDTRGVYKSEDSGETFNAAVKLKKGDIRTISINAIALDPSNPDVLYAGAGSGIYKSENAAAGWTLILTGVAISDVAVDPIAPKTIYASGLVGQNGKIIKSIDGGASWVDIYTEPSKNNTVLSVQVSKSNSSVILAGLLGGEVVRSNDAGRTWQATKDFADKVIKIKFGSGDTVYALTGSKGLFKSFDSGVNWSSIADSLINQTFSPVGQNTSSVTAFYDLSLDSMQQGVLYLGTEQGIFRSVNDGANWSSLPLPVKNAALRVSAVTVNPGNSNNLYASVVSTIYKSSNGGVSWEIKRLPTSSTIHTIVFNPASANVIYLGVRSQ